VRGGVLKAAAELSESRRGRVVAIEPGCGDLRGETAVRSSDSPHGDCRMGVVEGLERRDMFAALFFGSLGGSR
jgi:hypothetical protein